MTEVAPTGEQGATPARQQTSGLAVASLVIGIVGLTLVPLFASILGLVFGYMARGDIRRNPSLTGDGLATAGIILGWIAVALMGLVVVGFVLLATG